MNETKLIDLGIKIGRKCKKYNKSRIAALTHLAEISENKFKEMLIQLAVEDEGVMELMNHINDRKVRQYFLLGFFNGYLE